MGSCVVTSDNPKFRTLYGTPHGFAGIFVLPPLLTTMEADSATEPGMRASPTLISDCSIYVVPLSPWSANSSLCFVSFVSARNDAVLVLNSHIKLMTYSRILFGALCEGLH
jgi:hypothetical protein